MIAAKDCQSGLLIQIIEMIDFRPTLSAEPIPIFVRYVLWRSVHAEWGVNEGLLA